MRLVLLALLDGAAGGVQIRDLLEALDALALEIRVGHRVAENGATRRPRARRRAPSQRAIGDLPQPVRTAETATTGTAARSIVRSGPSRRKSAPVASARDATRIRWAWVTSL